MKTWTIKKALALTALTLAPALALTSSAQAAPAYRGQATTRHEAPSNWNNNSHSEGPRFDNHYNPAPRVQAPRYVPQYNQPRYDTYRNDGRFDSRRDYGRNQNNGSNNTAKIIGAGIVGAILGAVLSH